MRGVHSGSALARRPPFVEGLTYSPYVGPQVPRSDTPERTFGLEKKGESKLNSENPKGPGHGLVRPCG